MLTLLVEQSARLAPEAEHPGIYAPASAIATTSSAIAIRIRKRPPAPAGAQYAFAEPWRPRPQQPPDDITTSRGIGRPPSLGRAAAPADGGRGRRAM